MEYAAAYYTPGGRKAQKRGIYGSHGSSIIKAMAIGTLIGFLMSAAYYMHNREIQRVRSQLQAQLTHHDKAMREETDMRELAQQLQNDVNTERTVLQARLKQREEEVEGVEKEAQNSKLQFKRAEMRQTNAEKDHDVLKMNGMALMKQAEQLMTQLAFARDQQADISNEEEPHKPWVPSQERDAKDPELAAMLSKVAINNELIVAICNRNLAYIGGPLEIWIRNIQRAGIPNVMVVALDDRTEEVCKNKGMTVIRLPPLKKEGQADYESNHVVSAMKFTYLQRFLALGYSCFLSDVDVLFFQNPFPYLARDSDIEGMSDGWDNGTAYGYNDVYDDPRMGWARHAHSMRIFCMNSGLFFIRPTQASMNLLKRVVFRIDNEQLWDQAVFNEVVFFPGSVRSKETVVLKRILDYYKFMNSKTLWNEVRYSEEKSAILPVTLHVNFHVNKLDRLIAAESFYINGDKTRLMELPLTS